MNASRHKGGNNMDWTSKAVRIIAYVSILVFALAAVVTATTGTRNEAVGYMAAAGWCVIYLIMGKS